MVRLRDIFFLRKEHTNWLPKTKWQTLHTINIIDLEQVIFSIYYIFIYIHAGVHIYIHTYICIHSITMKKEMNLKEKNQGKEGYMLGFQGQKGNDVIVLLHQN